jgi:hypothetical protein
VTPDIGRANQSCTQYITCNLQVVPFLPYLFDKPVEHAVDYVFEKIEHRLVENHAAVVKANKKVDDVVQAVKDEL